MSELRWYTVRYEDGKIGNTTYRYPTTGEPRRLHADALSHSQVSGDAEAIVYLEWSEKKRNEPESTRHPAQHRTQS